MPKNPSPCRGLGCGPSANTRAGCNRTAAMLACKHVENISSGPSSHDYMGNSDLFWLDFSHFQGLPFWIGKKYLKKVTHNHWGNGVTFYFVIFIQKFHILVTRGLKIKILTIFGHVSAILEYFLTELKKNKTKKLHITFEDMGFIFLSPQACV